MQKGYKNISEDYLDRKMRNMKKTYRTIKDNNKKTSTGKGRISWEYFDVFEEIFQDDRTVNIGSSLSSLVESQRNEQHRPTNELLQQEFNREESIDSLSNNSEHNKQFSLHIPYPINSRSPSPSCTLSTVSSIINSDFSPILPLDDSALVQNEPIPSPSLNSDSQSSSAILTSNNQSTIRHKGLRALRKEQLQLDTKRTQLLEELVESINKANEIQQRRNELLEMLITQRNNRDGQNN